MIEAQVRTLIIAALMCLCASVVIVLYAVDQTEEPLQFDPQDGHDSRARSGDVVIVNARALDKQKRQAILKMMLVERVIFTGIPLMYGNDTCRMKIRIKLGHGSTSRYQEKFDSQRVKLYGVYCSLDPGRSWALPPAG